MSDIKYILLIIHNPHAALMTNYYADQDPKSHMISSSEIKNKYATQSNPAFHVYTSVSTIISPPKAGKFSSQEGWLALA